MITADIVVDSKVDKMKMKDSCSVEKNTVVEKENSAAEVRNLD